MSAVEAFDDDEEEDYAHPCRPLHSRKYAQFSPEWYLCCDSAFKAKMRQLAAEDAQANSEQTNNVTLLVGYYKPMVQK